MIQSDVEPNRRVERAILVQTESRQLIVEPIGVGRRGEITVVPSPVGDRAGNSIDQLANRILAVSRRRAPIAAGHVAVKVLADDHVGCELTPRSRNFAIGLLEDDPAALVLDLRRAQLPVDVVVTDSSPPLLKTRGISMPRVAPALFSLADSHAISRSSDGPTTPARSLTVAMTALRVSTHPSGHSRNPTPTRVNRKCSEVHRCTEVESRLHA